MMARQSGQKFLVLLDGSEYSNAIIEYIIGLIPPHKNKLVLFHIHRKGPDSFWDLSPNPGSAANPWKGFEYEDIRRWKVESFLEAAKHKLVQAGFGAGAIEIKLKGIAQGVARDIISEGQNGYDAVIAGQRGMNTLRELVMGGVASKLIQGLKNLPLILVSQNERNNKFLVAMDGSAGSMKAVDFLGSVLRNSESEITLFHAVGALPREEDGVETDGVMFDAVSAWVKDHLCFINHLMDKARNNLIDHGLKEDNITLKIVTGVQSRAGAILDTARKGEYGTVVGGRRGVTQAKNHSMGSVTAKLAGMARRRSVWIVASYLAHHFI